MKKCYIFLPKHLVNFKECLQFMMLRDAASDGKFLCCSEQPEMGPDYCIVQVEYDQRARPTLHGLPFKDNPNFIAYVSTEPFYNAEELHDSFCVEFFNKYNALEHYTDKHPDKKGVQYCRVQIEGLELNKDQDQLRLINLLLEENERVFRNRRAVVVGVVEGVKELEAGQEGIYYLMVKKSGFLPRFNLLKSTVKVTWLSQSYWLPPNMEKIIKMDICVEAFHTLKNATPVVTCMELKTLIEEYTKEVNKASSIVNNDKLDIGGLLDKKKPKKDVPTTTTTTTTEYKDFVQKTVDINTLFSGYNYSCTSLERPIKDFVECMKLLSKKAQKLSTTKLSADDKKAISEMIEEAHDEIIKD